MTRASRRWTLLAVLGVAAVLALVYSGRDSRQERRSPEQSRTAGAETAGGTADVATDPSVISEARAIAIARAWVVEGDSTFDFATRFDIVRDHGDTYEISFPRRAPTAFGGEPHVIVDKTTGEIVNSWHTL